MKLISVNQAVAREVMTYPSLYAGHSYEMSRVLVLDQILNVIGNGIDGREAFLQQFMAGPDTLDLPEMPPAWLVDGTTLFDGYAEYSTMNLGGKREIKLPDGNSLVATGVREEDQAMHPHAALWQTIIPITSLCPYPNFGEKYSIYHRMGEEGRAILGSDWLEAVDWFYGQCHDYFMGDCSQYPSAHPGEDGDLAVQRFIEYTQNLRTPEMSEAQFFEQISSEYGQPYSGDPEAFLAGRWETEKARILQFIEDTRKMVSAQLDALPAAGVISSGPRM